MTTEQVIRFIHQRREYYKDQYEYFLKIASLWKTYRVTTPEGLCTMFKIFNENNVNVIDMFENSLITKGDIDFKDVRISPWVVSSLPDDVDEEEVENYVISTISRLSRAARIESVRKDLVFLYYSGLNENDAETIKRVAHLQDKDEPSLRLYEWRVINREEIFSLDLKYANGHPKTCPVYGYPVSGVYRIHELVGDMSFCHLRHDVVFYEAIIPFQKYCEAPLSEHLSELSFATDDESTQTNTSSAATTNSGRPTFQMRFLTKHLTVQEFMTYKHEKLVSSASAASSSSLQNVGSHSSSFSVLDEGRSNTSHAGNQRKSRSQFRTERQQMSDSSRSDLDVHMTKPNLTFRSMKASELAVEPVSSSSSKSGTSLSSSVLTQENVSSKSCSIGGSNGHAQRERKSRSQFRTDRQPMSDSSRSDLDVHMTKPNLTFRSMKASELVVEPVPSSSSKSGASLSSSVLTQENVSSKSSSIGGSNEHAQRERKSRSSNRTERVPLSESSQSVYYEPSRGLEQTPSRASITNSVASFYMSEIGISDEPITVESWERLYKRFARISAITKSIRRDAYEVAIVLKPILVKFFLDAHEYKHVGYLKLLNPEDMTDSQVLMILFMKLLQNNKYTSAIIFRLLSLEMDKTDDSGSSFSF